MLAGQGKISAQPHTTLCIQFLSRENNDKNNTFPLGKQICFTIVWGCTETLPWTVPTSENPADLGSLGSSVNEAEQWWNGRPGLSDPFQWPADNMTKGDG